MESFFEYPTVLIMLGFLALIIDIGILGFSSFVLSFLGLATLLTGILMLVGILPETMVATVWSVGILTAVLAIVLWKPLRKFQNKSDTHTLHNDFTDKQFVLNNDVDHLGLSEYQYSGVLWKLKSVKPINKGALVTIDKADVGVLWVREISQ